MFDPAMMEAYMKMFYQGYSMQQYGQPSDMNQPQMQNMNSMNQMHGYGQQQPQQGRVMGRLHYQIDLITEVI